MICKRILMKLSGTLGASAVFAAATILSLSPSYAYAGTLENGNLAYAASEFNKGSACDYLPGYETGYDAWHLVLTTRGATFQADPTNPKVSVNLNIVFMRTDGTKYVIKSGALVQFGKGAYVYTLTKDKDRIVQAGSLATINGSDSGMRLSHTCPGSGTATYVPTIQPSPTPTSVISPSPTPTASQSPSGSNATTTISPTPAPTPTTKFAGTLENGNLAYAESEFNKGEACNYLPGYETGYDAWHLVLTTRGATFVQDPRDVKKSIYLNILFQRTDGSRYVITSGAWVQFGKGAYVYTPTSAKDRIVQSGTWAETNTISSGMRLSHTCPGTSAVTVASPTPTPVSTPTPTPTPVSTPTPTPVSTPTPTPTPSKGKDSCKLCVTKSFAKETPRPSESPGPGYRKLEPSPSPEPSSSPTSSPTPTPKVSPTPTSSPKPTPTPTPTRNNELTPKPEPSLPVPPPVEDPKTVIFVTPNEPVVISSRELTGTPNTPIQIVSPPQYGTAEVRNNVSLVYTSNLTDPKSTVVDIVVYQYTNLSGSVVVARKEFLLKQEGDVPRIIQTGKKDSLWWLSSTIILVSLALVLYLLARRNYRREGAL